MIGGVRAGKCKGQLKLLGACVGLLLSLFAIAAPNEIKVFTDELATYGEHTLETHVNKASRAGPAADNKATPLQVMPEYSYGIWRNWEFSLQLPVAEQHDRVGQTDIAQNCNMSPHTTMRRAFTGA